MHRSPGVIWREGEFGVVLLPPGAREPKTLTGTGRALWAAIAEPTTPAALAADLAATFAADPAQVEKDIAPVLDELRSIGALTEVPLP